MERVIMGWRAEWGSSFSVIDQSEVRSNKTLVPFTEGRMVRLMNTLMHCYARPLITWCLYPSCTCQSAGGTLGLYAYILRPKLQ